MKSFNISNLDILKETYDLEIFKDEQGYYVDGNKLDRIISSVCSQIENMNCIRQLLDIDIYVTCNVEYDKTIYDFLE